MNDKEKLEQAKIHVQQMLEFTRYGEPKLYAIYLYLNNLSLILDDKKPLGFDYKSICNNFEKQFDDLNF